MRLLALVLVLGCGGSPKRRSQPTSVVLAEPTVDCNTAVGAMMKAFQIGMDDDMRPLVPQMTAIMAKHCAADAWSGDALDCMSKVATVDEAGGCEKTMTQDQRTKLKTEIAAATADEPQPAQPDATTNASVEMPPECVHYALLIAKLRTCTRVAPEVLAAFNKDFDDREVKWNKQNTASERTAQTKGCELQVAAVAKSGEAAGCAP